MKPTQLKREATPQSRNAASVSASAAHKAPEVRSALKNDLANTSICSFDAYLHYILCRVKAISRDTSNKAPTSDEIEEDLRGCLRALAPLMNKAEVPLTEVEEKLLEEHEEGPSEARATRVIALLKKYSEGETETKRYSPFVAAVNESLRLLQPLTIGNAGPSPEHHDEEHFLMFLVHDAKIKSGVNGSTRKPDVDFTFLGSINREVGMYSDRKSVPSYGKTLHYALTRPDYPLRWELTLGSIELKVSKKTLPPPRTREEYAVAVGDEMQPQPDDQKTLTRPKPSKKRGRAKEPDGHEHVSKRVKNSRKAVPQQTTKTSIRVTNESASIAQQVADYAAEAMSGCFGRDHVVNFAITDDVLNVWYFDHQSPIQTHGINFIRNLPHFWLLLFAFQRFKIEDWGYIPDLYPLIKDNQGKLQSVCLTDEAKPPQKRVFSDRDVTRDQRPFGLNTRATFVVHGMSAKNEDSPKTRPSVLKLSYREVSRTSEQEFIQAGRERCRKNGFDEFCAYLPKILFAKQYPEFSTSLIRFHLGIMKIEEAKAIRAPNLICMPEYKPITTTTGNWHTFMDYFITLFFCHALLWALGIEHGDISEANLMWDPKTKMPKLCDYDLSHFTNDIRPAGFSNTGTWRFMALEVLTADAVDGNVKRVYRHDAESFVMVLVWILCRFQDGNEIPQENDTKNHTNPKPLDDWIKPNFADVRMSRERTYDNLFTMSIPEGVPEDVWKICTSFWSAYRLGIADGAKLREYGRIDTSANGYDQKNMQAMDVKFNSIHFIDYFLMKNHDMELPRTIAERLWKFAHLPRVLQFITDNSKFQPQRPLKPAEDLIARATIQDQ